MPLQKTSSILRSRRTSGVGNEGRSTDMETLDLARLLLRSRVEVQLSALLLVIILSSHVRSFSPIRIAVVGVYFPDRFADFRPPL